MKTFLLVLLFSPFQIGVLPREDFAACQQEAKNRIGEKMQVTAGMDPMGGPIPKIIAAFCVEGVTSHKE